MRVMLVTLILSVFTVSIFGWTYRIYNLVLEKALDSVPNEILHFLEEKNAKEKLLKGMKWNDDFGKDEHLQKPIHYFKTEVYNLNEDNIPLSFSKAKRKMRGDRNKAISNGMLPWVTIRYSKACIDLFTTNPSSFPTAVGLMTHFITDLNSPFHLTRNLNGEMTNQKGIHIRWEKIILDRLDSLDLHTVQPRKIDDVELYIFENILKVREKLEDILETDLVAKERGNGYTKEYENILFDNTKEIAEQLLQNSIQMVSDILYTAFLTKKDSYLSNLSITMIKIYHWGDDRYVILQNKGKRGVNIKNWKLKAYDYDRGCLLNYFEFPNLILTPMEKVSVHSGPRARVTRASDQFWSFRRIWTEHNEAVLIDENGIYMDIYVY